MVTMVGSICPAAICSKISSMRKVSACRKSRRIPMAKPTSPTRVVMKAFFAASALSRSWYQKPIRR